MTEKHNMPKEHSLDSMDGIELEKNVSEQRIIPEYKIKGKISEFEEDRIETLKVMPDNISDVQLFSPCGNEGEAFIDRLHEKIKRANNSNPTLGIEAVNFILANAPDEWKGYRILLWTFFRSDKDFPMLKFIKFDSENEIWLVNNLILDMGGLATESLPGAVNHTNIWGTDKWRIAYIKKPDDKL